MPDIPDEYLFSSMNLLSLLLSTLVVLSYNEKNIPIKFQFIRLTKLTKFTVAQYKIIVCIAIRVNEGIIHRLW